MTSTVTYKCMQLVAIQAVAVNGYTLVICAGVLASVVLGCKAGVNRLCSLTTGSEHIGIHIASIIRTSASSCIVEHTDLRQPAIARVHQPGIVHAKKSTATHCLVMHTATLLITNSLERT